MRDPLKTGIYVYTAVTLLCLALGVLALILKSGDIDGAEAAANRYCQMVYTGQWPDYQQNYEQFCNKDKWNGK